MSWDEFRTIPPRLTKKEWNALLDHGLVKEASVIIYKDNKYTIALDGRTSKILYKSTDSSVVIQKAINTLTNGGTVYLKEIQLSTKVTYGDNILIIEDYRGERKVYSNQGKFIIVPLLSTDPDTTGWSIAERGRIWFNTSVNKIRIWNGSKILTIPASEVGGGGIESGKVEIDATTVGMKRGIVKFVTPFDSVPTVQTSIENPTPPTVDWGRVFAKNITKTQFEYEVEIMLAQPGGKVYLVWQTQV